MVLTLGVLIEVAPSASAVHDEVSSRCSVPFEFAPWKNWKCKKVKEADPWYYILLFVTDIVLVLCSFVLLLLFADWILSVVAPVRSNWFMKIYHITFYHITQHYWTSHHTTPFHTPHHAPHHTPHHTPHHITSNNITHTTPHAPHHTTHTTPHTPHHTTHTTRTSPHHITHHTKPHTQHHTHHTTHYTPHHTALYDTKSYHIRSHHIMISSYISTYRNCPTESEFCHFPIAKLPKSPLKDCVHLKLKNNHGFNLMTYLYRQCKEC